MRFRKTATLVALFFITTQRLPAPIVEEQTPKPAAPKPKAESKAPVKKSEPTESGMSSRSVRVVLTDNTKAAIVYLKTYVQTIESIPFAPKSDVRPDEIMEQLRQALSTRFSNVSILSGSSSSKDGLTMFFDLQAHVASSSGTKNTVSVIATFKNNSGRTIQTISSSGTSTMPYPAFATRFPQAVSAAFADFSQKLNAAR
jgi:hypothetical protein